MSPVTPYVVLFLFAFLIGAMFVAVLKEKEVIALLIGSVIFATVGIAWDYAAMREAALSETDLYTSWSGFPEAYYTLPYISAGGLLIAALWFAYLNHNEQIRDKAAIPTVGVDGPVASRVS